MSISKKTLISKTDKLRHIKEIHANMKVVAEHGSFAEDFAEARTWTATWTPCRREAVEWCDVGKWAVLVVVCDWVR